MHLQLINVLPGTKPLMMQLRWEDYQADFEFDGSWRDIYVLDTSVSDWQLLVDFLRSGAYEVTYGASGDLNKPDFLPASAKEIFEGQFAQRTSMSVKAGSVLLNCHFFLKEQIEFDLDPREIQSEAQAEHVFAFMEHLASLLNKEVVLTPENLPGVPIFRFVPSKGQIEYIPCDT